MLDIFAVRGRLQIWHPILSKFKQINSLLFPLKSSENPETVGFMIISRGIKVNQFPQICLTIRSEIRRLFLNHQHNIQLIVIFYSFSYFKHIFMDFFIFLNINLFHVSLVWLFQNFFSFYISIISFIFTLPASPIFGKSYKNKNFNFYFHTSLWCLKRFYEGLSSLRKTFYGTTKKCDNKNLS